MNQRRFVLLVFFTLSILFADAQVTAVPCFKGAVKEKRLAARRNIINNIITKNLSVPLTDSTEENWKDAFWAMEVMQYKTPWINACVHAAFDSVEKRSVSFQRALLELCYANYPSDFGPEINRIVTKTTDEKIFSICAEYLMQLDSFKSTSEVTKERIINILGVNLKSDTIKPVLRQALSHIYSLGHKENNAILNSLLSKAFLSKNVLVYSFQRRNRDYPGLAMVRDINGNFIKNNDGGFFSVPQLARSISNLPSYLTNGNTPQGIFRMDGFAVSRADFIGPTENIQLTMPFETSIKHFLKDSSITDTTWTIDLYKKLLPAALKDSMAFYECYYAGEAGRTEIIAHGTTIDPEYYKDKPYYPQTPTMGCLCTEEVWSSIDGKRVISDQQQLVDAVKKAGGANGYYIVIELDDAQKPVSIDDILPFIK